MGKNYSGVGFIDALLSDSSFAYSPVLSWSQAATVGQAATVTYDFMTVTPSTGQGDPPIPGDGNFQPFTTAQRAATVSAIALISEVANISFARSTAGEADIEFGMTGLPGISSSYTSGLAQNGWSGDGTTAYYTQSRVWMTNRFGVIDDIAPGSGNFSTLLHEIGHAIGLDHPFDPPNPLPAAQDTEQYTLMSYTKHPLNTDLDPQTMMLYDIAALQYLYGANMGTRAGNDTYSWSVPTLATIWDAGGTDAIVGSANLANTINLNAGSFSSIGGRTNNIGIAFNVTIEVAAGGSFNDVITGNAAGNFISGGSYIFAPGAFSNGADQMDGAVGFDSVSWNDAPLGVVVNLGNQAQNSGAAAGDTALNFEGFLLTSHNDVFFANLTGTFVYAYGGSDQVYGGLASDLIDGGAGADHIDGNDGFDYASYNSAAAGVTVNFLNVALSTGDAAGDIYARLEAFILSEFDDSYIGGNGANFAFGYGGNDQLYGAASSNDWLFGGNGNDFMSAGTLNDLLSGGAGLDTYVLLDDATNGFDSILDFTTGADKFALDDIGFGLIAGQPLVNGLSFIASAAPVAVGGLGTILYNTANGILTYDPDGVGAAGQLALAQILNAPTLASTDFVVI